MLRIQEKREKMEQIADARAELARLRESLSEAYSVFNSTVDPQLLEACILEISALHSRYSSALRNIKSMDGDRVKWNL